MLAGADEIQGQCQGLLFEDRGRQRHVRDGLREPVYMAVIHGRSEDLTHSALRVGDV